jgi:hypothetical protein
VSLRRCFSQPPAHQQAHPRLRLYDGQCREARG